jgi:thioredoxin reductase (NADPH)
MDMHDGMRDVIIIGSGIAGMSAALYCGRFLLRTMVIGDLPGGTLNIAGAVENYPGLPGTSGLELATKVAEHAQSYGIEVLMERAGFVERKAGAFEVKAGGKAYRSKAVIFATGGEWRKLGVPGEEEFQGKGVHNCAICDGPLYKGKVLAVVGGSDSAAKEALVLSEYASKVYVIYRRGEIRAEPINLRGVQERVKSGAMEIITDTNVTRITGEAGGRRVAGVELDRPYKGKAALPLDGVFIDIGHVPLSGLAKGLGVKLNPRGEIETDKNGRTSVPGIFAAGDVTDCEFKQAVTAAAEGTKAAYSAYQFVSKKEVE